MGLDGVELVMEVEERFGVAISDEEADAIRTVGDLAELLEQRVARREATGCLSLPWFLKLRRLVREVLGNDAARVRPSERLVERLSPNERRRLWCRLDELLGSRPRALQRPDWLERPLGWLLCGSVLAVLGSPVIAYLPYGWHLLMSIPLLVLGTIGLYFLTRPLLVYPPPGYESFGGITRVLVGREAATVGFPRGDRDLLFAELTHMIVEQLGVDPDEVTRDARFVEDLNMD